jgi:Eukaryotic mitochondrial regulator protein
MLPTTKYSHNPPKHGPAAHESINDLPVHGATVQQIFHPTSESREFTREDAARVFDETLLPADKRIPHPELVEMEKERLAGVPYATIKADALKREEEAMRRKLISDQRQREREERELKVVSGKRWDFKFQEISVDEAGADGRGYKGVGWRYGVPNRDRKRGEIKIPTRVE